MSAGFTPTTLQKAGYTKLESRLRRITSAVAERLSADTLSPRAALLNLLSPLSDATREAMRLGKSVGLGGASVLLTPAEEARARALFDAQAAHLRAWLLASGPLVKSNPGKPGGVGIGPRLDMYALSVHAAYQTGLAFGLLQAASQEKGMALFQDDPVWLWERSPSPGLHSCADCLAREAASHQTPYTLTQLLSLGFPAQGRTRCLTRCRCRVRLVDTFSTQLLRDRAHGRSKPTAYHGVTDPSSLAAAHGSTVGTPSKNPNKS